MFTAPSSNPSSAQPAGQPARATVSEAPAILDMEASGFGKDSYPVEVGFVLPDGKAFCTLIKPAPEWTHWDSAAQALHHITRELAVRRGHEPIEVARALNRQLAGRVVYSDGWMHDYT